MPSTLTQTQPSVSQLHWRGLTAIAALLLVAAALAVYFIASGNDDPSPGPTVHSLRSTGPNEAARGQAAASAAGAQPVLPSGGPNETARGLAASQAAR